MISLFGSNVSEKELSSVKDCFNRQWLGLGPKTKEFETKLSQKIGTTESCFVNSGSNALILALKLMKLPEGSEVILPSFTWIACANAVRLNKLKPVFCDVDLRSGNVRPQDVEKKITKNTSAIMVVHYGGKPVDMDGLKVFNLPILEDAAHAIDSYYKGKHCGTIGTAGIYSFDAVKNITTGEGGAVVTKDSSLMREAFRLRYCGIAKSGFDSSASKNRWWEYDITDFFPKLINTDMAAAMGIEQLNRLPSFQKRRKEIWDHYNNAFEKESWANDWIITPAKEEAHEQHSYFTYMIRIKSGSRDAMAKFLYDNGVYTSLRYHPLHLCPIFESTSESLENSELLNEHALNIPLHHRMSDEEVDKVVTMLKTFREKYI